MTPLGKPLVFHLKYMAEMGCLNADSEEGNKPALTGLDDAIQVREMAHVIGAAASEQAADFLEQCDQKIEGHFTGLGIGNIYRKRRRALVLREWGSNVVFGISSVSNGWFCYGVRIADASEARACVEEDVCGVVVPWLWSKGGRRGEDAVWNILGGWPHSRSGEGLVWEKGAVALACIPIKAQPPEGFDVDCDPLIEEVAKTFVRISAAQVTTIASLNAGFKKSDEE